ncbi:hypothetical protein HY383_01775 [Candidatus Daviesbacteria bacterium]|nr:hypothetical protein [Candidatus Daviesbacteria bacterium]
MEYSGILAAVGAALAWGTFMVPFKISKSSKLVLFQAFMSVGILISGLVLSLILGYPLKPNIYGIFAGVMWAIANLLALSAISNLGLCRAVPLLSSLVVISSFLWGALVFGELPAGILLGVVGVMLIILGVVLVSTVGSNQALNIKKGLLAGVVAGLIFGSQLVPLKIGHVTTGEAFFSTGLGIFVTAMMVTIFSRTKFSKEIFKAGLLSGVIWNMGNLLSLISLSLIGLSKAGPISQIATAVAVLWGLFYFKEVTIPAAKLQVLMGSIILLVGVIILGLA